jgi:hypothetical protein
MKHYVELALQILQRAACRHGKMMFENLWQFMEMKEEDKNELLAFFPVVVFIRYDGKHNHKITLLQNIAVSVAFVELLQLHALVNNRNAPDGSWINSVERCMSILNLGLAHPSYARDECNTRESLVKSFSSMKALRDLGDRDEMVNEEMFNEEWSQIITVIMDDIGSKMSQLLLKDEPVTVKLLPLPQPPVRARMDARKNASAQRDTQLRSVLARMYAVSIQNQITTTVP